MPFYNNATGFGQPTTALTPACVMFVYHSRGGDTSAADAAAVHIRVTCGQIVAVIGLRRSTRPCWRIRSVPFEHQRTSVPMFVVTSYLTDARIEYMT